MHWTYISLSTFLTFWGASCYDGSLDSKVIAGSEFLPRITYQSVHFNDSSEGYSDLERRQTAGRCGSSFSNQKCDTGLCCSFYGYCGTGQVFCDPIASCQADFGYCGDNPPAASAPSSTSVEPPPPAAPTSTSTSTSAVVIPTTSSNPPPPPPPSPTTSSTSTSSIVIIPPTTSSAIPVPPTTLSTVASHSTILPPPIQSQAAGTLVTSTSGMCGNSTTCAGSGFGVCCSQFWYCGNGLDYCGSGCNPNFGFCFGAVSPPAQSIASQRPSSSAIPPPVILSTSVAPIIPSTSVAPVIPSTSAAPVVPSTSIAPIIPTTSTRPIVTTTSAPPPPPPSTTSSSSTTSAAPPPSAPTQSAAPVAGPNTSTDGSCGTNGKSCTGSTFGNCCSAYGFCGTADLYCSQLLGCQPKFGTCNPIPASFDPSQVWTAGPQPGS